MNLSGQRFALKTIPQGTDGDTGATKVEGYDRYHIQAVFTGTGTGSIKLQIGVDGINFSDYPDSELTYPPAVGTNHQWEVREVGHAYVRVVTVSGAVPNGNINISFFGKQYR